MIVGSRNIVFEVIPYASAAYREAVRLREAVLRAPLGLTFTPEELEAEKDHLHLVGLEGETVCATAVLVPEGKAMKMQRVAVPPELRGRGIGRALMTYCERVAREHEAKTIYVHARDSAVPFYEKNWYVGDGELFDEDGIPHLKMWKLLV
ncbi:MAG: GNAT family N-acetyltransferase [Alphaproteobacteria bacterium]|jgi:predicted GNAT family N-acyltransferase|nr:GNAT family N-acetyltransferase [Alphaproteobacteria bacterium]QQS57300.1 MAG: GNAT family N-acetyltransferase [Alphaproteobacteria bacterium]